MVVFVEEDKCADYSKERKLSARTPGTIYE